MHQEYKQFKPMKKLPVSFENQGQLDKMKDAIKRFVVQSENKVASIVNFQKWLNSFDLKSIDD